MWVVIYEKSTTDCVHRIRQVIKVAALRWTFEGGIRDTAWEAVAILHIEEDDQMEHSQYQHFLSWAHEGADAVVIPAEGRDRIGCLANQVKPTRSLVQDLNEDIKEIQHLGNHGEESSQKITELEALCKHKKDATTKLKEEKVNLVGMFQSHDEVIMEIVDEFGLNYMGENNDDED
jgi:hypothetical protein